MLELRDDRRSRLSNAAAAVWPTDSRKVEARMMRKALRMHLKIYTLCQGLYLLMVELPQVYKILDLLGLCPFLCTLDGQLPF